MTNNSIFNTYHYLLLNLYLTIVPTKYLYSFIFPDILDFFNKNYLFFF